MVFISIFAILISAALADAQTSAPPNPYRALESWAQLPAGTELGQVSGVELDSRGNIWVIHRSDPPILQFDASGKLLKSFGDWHVRAGPQTFMSIGRATSGQSTETGATARDTRCSVRF